jgi:hypothetical protein
MPQIWCLPSSGCVLVMRTLAEHMGRLWPWRWNLSGHPSSPGVRNWWKRADIGETIQSASIKSHFDGWLASKRARKSEATGERTA